MSVKFYLDAVYICVVFNLQFLTLNTALTHNLDYFEHSKINLTTYVVWLESIVFNDLLVKQILSVREKKFV